MGEITEEIAPTGNLFVKRYDELPCRNPARIQHMLSLLLSVWALEANVDMRLGQLLINAARLGGWASDDIWNCEEEIFAQGFLKMLEMAAGEASG